MAYVERDDGDLNLNDQSDIYDDDSLYDEMYEAENFGERVDSGDDVMEMDAEEVKITEDDGNNAETDSDDGFGETISPETDSKGSDKVDNQGQVDDSDTESSDNSKKEGLFSKAKEKLDEWTDKDERE
jgi:hypothetical protein